MAHQGYDLQLTRYDNRGWHATFYTTGMEHSPKSAAMIWADALASSRRGPGGPRVETRHDDRRRRANL
jgi:hypothetical protein